ncbi:hypothetical protein B0H13DRAFT_1886504 [Mycena leptocephala]|nr:hypothetical protein B0H13DRAFT_1886504 [Mycena leptocephala]
MTLFEHISSVGRVNAAPDRAVPASGIMGRERIWWSPLLIQLNMERKKTMGNLPQMQDSNVTSKEMNQNKDIESNLGEIGGNPGELPWEAFPDGGHFSHCAARLFNFTHCGRMAMRWIKDHFLFLSQFLSTPHFASPASFVCGPVFTAIRLLSTFPLGFNFDAKRGPVNFARGFYLPSASMFQGRAMIQSYGTANYSSFTTVARTA